MTMQRVISYLRRSIPFEDGAPCAIQGILDAFSSKMDVNDCLEEGKTLLHCLADLAFPIGGSAEYDFRVKSFQLNAVSTLFDNFANPLSTDENGRTPLHYAVMRSNPLLARRLLVQDGAAIYMRDSDHRLPIDYISPPLSEGDWENLHILLERLDETTCQEFVDSIIPSEWKNVEDILELELREMSKNHLRKAFELLLGKVRTQA